MKRCFLLTLSILLSFHYSNAFASIVQLSSDRWSEYKALRLRALADDPEALAINMDDEKDLPESYWKNNLENPSLFFAEEGGILVGMISAVYEYSSISYCRHLVTITGMYVAPEVRGKGIGYKLMSALLRQLGKNNKPTLAMLWVAASREPAIRLYEKCGFERSGMFKDSVLIDGRYIDSLLMQKMIVK